MAESIEQLSDDSFRGSFGAFLEELERAVFDEEQGRILSDMEDVQGAWQYVLAWLTRDQECRIDGLTHWRHPESSSHSPVRNAGVDTRLNVLRVAIGLYSQESSTLRKQVTTTSSRAEGARAAAKRVQTRFDSLQEELATALGVEVERIWPPQAGLFHDEQRSREAHFQSLMALADQRIRSTRALSLKPADASEEDKLEQNASELARVKQKVENLINEIERMREHAKLLERKSAERWADTREAKHPTCPYDGTPLDVEKANFVCPLPRLPDPAAASRIAAEADAARQKLLANLVQSEGTLTSLRGDKASLEAKVSALRRKIEAQQLAASAVTTASQAAWATKGMLRRLFEVRADVDQTTRAEAEAKEALRSLQDRQIVGLSAYSTAKLERWFDFLIRRVVAPEAKGTVSLDGNGLHPKIHWRGTRRSVALNSLQIVLFDLAAMLCSVEGDSRAPAFSGA